MVRGAGKARVIWVVLLDGGRVKDYDGLRAQIMALKYMVCLVKGGIPKARIGLFKTIQFASGRRGSYV